MTRSLYVIGGAGVGKSTFMGELLGKHSFGPLVDLHSKPNAKALVTLRGHEILGPVGNWGYYLGVSRDEFPGSDGLDRASSPTGEEWLHMGELPPVIAAEGATLATRRFLYALHETTDLVVLALRCDPMVHELRLLARGSGQKETFVQSTITKTDNLVADLLKQGVQLYWIDTDDPDSWSIGLETARVHLEQA